MESNNRNNIDFREIVSEFLRRWLLFALFIIGFLTLAVLYIRFATKIYRIESLISLNVSETEVSNDRSGLFEGYEMINREKNFENEVLYLRSTPMIRNVIRDLNLNVTYYSKTDKIPKELHLGFINLYKQSPFLLIMDEDHVQPTDVMFYVNILDEENFVLYAEPSIATIYNYDEDRVVMNEKYFSLNGTFQFGENIVTEDCSFTIILNSNYQQSLYEGKDLFFVINDPQQQAVSYQRSLEINSSMLNSTNARIFFHSENLQMGIDFVNNLMDNYNLKNLETKNRTAQNTIRFIDNELSAISDSLGYAEQELQNFRRNYNVMNIDEKSENLYARLENLSQQRNNLQTDFQYLQQMEEYFQNSLDSNEFVVPSSIGFDNTFINNLLQELGSLISERDRIVQDGQLRNPRLKTLEVSIQNLKRSIYENIAFNRRSTESSLNEVRGEIAEINREFNRLPQTQRRLVDIERRYTLTESAYNALLEKRIQAQIAKASNFPDLEVIEPPRLNEISSPRTTLLLVVAMFLGFAIPAMYILVSNFMSTKIKSEKEIGSYTGRTVIGMIPFFRKPDKNIVQNYPNTGTSESFYSTKTSLDFYLDKSRCRTILFTSSIPGEGKSFTSLNIATAYAKSNAKTLLVNFDMRRNNELLSKYNDKDKGISNYLAGDAEMEDLVTHTKVKNLDTIASGDVPPNPVSLLSSERLPAFFEKMKPKYDCIIIDSPPYGLVTDAFILMNYVDHTLFLVRLGFSKKKAFAAIMREMSNKGLENVTILANGLKSNMTSTYYNKGYYGDTKEKKGIFHKVIDLILFRKRGSSK